MEGILNLNNKVKNKNFNLLSFTIFKKIFNLFSYDEDIIKEGRTPFEGLDLRDAQMRCLNFKDVSFSLSDLSGADLSRSIFLNANFKQTNLAYSDIIGTDLQKANLSECNLHGANLSGANLQKANIKKANFSFADLSGANLKNTIYSDETIFAKALFNLETELPFSYEAAKAKGMIFI